MSKYGFTTHFYGQAISDYGRKNGRVDYATFAKAFDAVLANKYAERVDIWDDAEILAGMVDNSEALEELDEQAERLDELEESLEELRGYVEDLDRAKTDLEGAIDWFDTELPSGEELDLRDLSYFLDRVDTWDGYEAIDNAVAQINEERERIEQEREELEDEQERGTTAEVMQWYIVSTAGADIIERELPSEVLYYIPKDDLHLWGVTHWGTSWDYVLTSIPCETYEEEQARKEAEATKDAEQVGDLDDIDDLLEELTAEDLLEDVDDLEEEQTTPDGVTLVQKMAKATNDYMSVLLPQDSPTTALYSSAYADNLRDKVERMLMHRFESGDLVNIRGTATTAYVYMADGESVILNGEAVDRNRFDLDGIIDGLAIRSPWME